MSPRITASLLVLTLSLLVWLYVREFPVFSNTIGAGKLVALSMLFGTLATGAVLWRLRERFLPLEKHLPEVLLIVFFSTIFSPLFGSLINRAFGSDTEQGFKFVSETAYYASGYGILKGEKPSPTGWRLLVEEKGKNIPFKYKTQAHFPLTRPGETIVLPLRKGCFGFRVMTLR
jgi:hypothetical protein